MTEKKNVIVLAEGCFDILEAKTAVGVIRYSKKFEVLSVIDSNHSGKNTNDIVGVGKNIPIVQSLDVALNKAKENNQQTMFPFHPQQNGILVPNSGCNFFAHENVCGYCQSSSNEVEITGGSMLMYRCKKISC